MSRRKTERGILILVGLVGIWGAILGISSSMQEDGNQRWPTDTPTVRKHRKILGGVLSGFLGAASLGTICFAFRADDSTLDFVRKSLHRRS